MATQRPDLLPIENLCQDLKFVDNTIQLSLSYYALNMVETCLVEALICWWYNKTYTYSCKCSESWSCQVITQVS